MTGGSLTNWRNPSRAATFGLLVVLLFLSGCDQIKSAARHLVNSGRAAKERKASRPSRPSPVSGPRLAVILDDVGSDSAVAEAIFALPQPVTISVLPHHAHSTEIADEAHRRGVQVMLHLPMQALGGEAPEIQELRSGMSSPEMAQILGGMLENVPHAAGVNNHQGSRATSDGALMAELMPLLRSRNLFFIDSRTTAATVAYDAAQRAGTRCAFRNVPFLDDVQDAAAIRAQWELAIRDAREKGQAIAIGHPHPETLRVLAELMPQAQTQGIHLVRASDLVH